MYNNYQKAIFRFVDSRVSGFYTGSQSAIVIAGPGSGKTTTIIEACNNIPVGTKSIILSFTNNIANEIATRAPKHIESSTLNALGWGICRKYKKVTLNKFKTWNTLREFFDAYDNVENAILYKIRHSITTMVSLLKAHVVTQVSEEKCQELAKYYNIEIPTIEELNYWSILKTVYGRCVENINIMDFDDQKFMPIIYDWPMPQYDFVFVDEAQDLAPLDTELIKRVARNFTIFVGDPWQSIYGFRGADVDSMENIKKEFNSEEFPLSICYRCADAIIEEAQKLNSSIEKPPGNRRGKVETIKSYEGIIQEGDFVLCRCTAPLIRECLKLLPKMNCYVKGRDLGFQLKNLIATITQENMDICEFDSLLDRHFSIQRERLNKLERDTSLLEDQVDSLKVFMEKCDDTNQLMDEIDRIISDSGSGVCFMTMHKAKGLETDRGFIIERKLVPHKRATLPWQLQQEKHLMFVAITRFKEELYFVE